MVGEYFNLLGSTNGNSAYVQVTGFTSTTQVTVSVASTTSTAFSASTHPQLYGHDDTNAFQKAIDIALGDISGNSLFTAQQQTQLLGLNGIGLKLNGAGTVRVPSGLCMVSAPLAAVFQRNSALGLVGEGTAQSGIAWTSTGDGLGADALQQLQRGVRRQHHRRVALWKLARQRLPHR